MTNLKTFAVATITLAAAAMPLSAANASEAREVSISYADLNLSTQAGQDVLDSRIANAIEAVCGRLENRPTFDSAVRRCQQETRVAAFQSRDIAVASYSRQQLAQARSNATPGSNEREIRFAVR